MRANRMIAGLVAVLALLGLSLVTAGSASAATGSWKAYGNTNPITSSPHTWKCDASKVISTNVLAQVCVIRSENGKLVQGAVIVRNNTNALFSTSASVTVWNKQPVVLGEWDCASSGVATKSWSVCFGQSFPFNPKADATGYAKGVYLGDTPDV
ncbi:hypothetical protein GCM10011609_21050 [Lentzea pudingi]|uniref:Secreted protein n=1 Tax=Lentzea pudingi TaxID=1789439 RepID=A0ABQ2HKW0_9PSEU|nr:hypothetical protein [Lentzea pudingi]GGM84675.1 hypothetical protein GCM10011609_21050 [Lentzea pudingi]